MLSYYGFKLKYFNFPSPLGGLVSKRDEREGRGEDFMKKVKILSSYKRLSMVRPIFFS
jgi:hypothetical protein